jgi:hypothetical protein
MTEAKKTERTWRKADGSILPPAPRRSPHQQSDLFELGTNTATLTGAGMRASTSPVVMVIATVPLPSILEPMEPKVSFLGRGHFHMPFLQPMSA